MRHICPLSTLVSRRFRNSSGRYTNNTRISAYIYLWIGIHQSYCIPRVPSCICITGYALFLEYPSHHIYWFCSVQPLPVQIFQDSTTITDLEMEGQVKPKVLLGIKDFFEMAALWFIPKLVFPALFVLIKNLAVFFNIVQKDSLSLILRVELFRF